MNEVTRETTDLKSKRKCRGYRSNCYNCEKKAWTKSELYGIQEPLTSVIQMQPSIHDPLAFSPYRRRVAMSCSGWLLNDLLSEFG